jgi:hypothetical protein
MPLLFPPGVEENKEPEKEPEVIQLSPEDHERLEKKFFLCYTMHLQPSEFDKMTEIEQEFFFQRLLAQKQMEQEAFQQMKRNQMGNAAPIDLIKEINKTKR